MSKNKNKYPSSKRQATKKELTGRIIGVFSNNYGKTFNYKQLSALLGIKSDSQRLMVSDILLDLYGQGIIRSVSRGKYVFDPRGGYVEGIIERHGVKMYLRPDDGSAPVFIPERKTMHALSGDRVKVHLYARRRGQEPEGEVAEILHRSKDTFVGVLDVKPNYAFLTLDYRVMNSDIFIPKDKLHGAGDGQKVVVKIISWEEKGKNPVGEVIDILGNKGENDTEMHAILAEFGLPYSYPAEVEAEAAKIQSGITTEEVARRADMREVPTMTIDPIDAKDFDDALSIRRLDNGLWEVGVHIADVTHYVRPGSLVENEAYRRATSVYLVDRTIPMLPEHLSNGICSLRPREEKLTYSVIFNMDDEAEVQSYHIVRTVIRSDRRFTYEEAQQVIETGEGDMRDEILTLDKLAKKLRDRRFARGAIAFDRVEVRFELDEKGKPVSVRFKEPKDANKLIEEFMLLANCTVATHIGKSQRGQHAKTFVYRIHDLPDSEKLSDFSNLIKRFGYYLKTAGKKSDVSKSINRLLDNVQGKKEQNLVETLAIRSMAKAAYSTTNIGHYGLASDYYTHFTSPIRRYPDMMVHRLLTHYADRGKSVNKEQWEEFCKHSSEMETIASNAERASIKYKQVEFMSEHIGETFDGMISGVTEWGIYVELLENKCEGMIPIRDLDDDYYVFDEKNYCVTGQRHHRRYQLGDPLRVKIAKAHLDRKQLDFVPADLHE